MEEIFEIKTCLEILKNIKIYKIDLQHVPLINYKVYIL